MTTSRPGARTRRTASRITSSAASGASRATAAAGGSSAADAGQPGWTARAAVLGLVVVVLAVTLTWPISLVLRQRGDINDLAARERAAAVRVERLESRLASLDDPAVIEAEARARLGWSREGETTYVVLGEDDEDRLAPRLTAGPQDTVTDGTPWWDQLLAEADGRPTDDPADEPGAVPPGAAQRAP